MNKLLISLMKMWTSVRPYKRFEYMRLYRLRIKPDITTYELASFLTNNCFTIYGYEPYVSPVFRTWHPQLLNGKDFVEQLPPEFRRHYELDDKVSKVYVEQSYLYPWEVTENHDPV